MIGLIAHTTAMSRLIAEMSVERLRELQRFAEVGRLSAGLIHDMSSPLTAAILHLEQGEPNGLASIRHARRSIRVLERYIEAARRQLCQQNQATLFCVRSEIYQTKYILQPLARQQSIQLRFNVRTCGHKLFGDPVKLQRIITNLAANAMDAYRDKKGAGARSVKVSAYISQEHLAIRVRDHGKGIAPEQLPHLFEPFYTTKSPGRKSGLGIGLSTVRQYVKEDFGGIISVTSSVNGGTEFQVELPLGPRDDTTD